MHPQLQEIEAEFEGALRRLRVLDEKYGDEEWARRPAPESWSAAECIAHLNLTSDAYLRLLPEGIERARALGGGAPERFRRDFQGWLVSAMTGPKPRIRVRTTASFVPTADQPKAVLVREFERFQKEQMDCVRAADGLPIHRVKVVSPFAANVRYSLYSALSLIAPHQHRHLGQAERTLSATPGAVRQAR